MRGEFFGDEYPDVGVSFDNLGMAAQARGDYAAADTLLRRSLAVARTAFGAEALEVAGVLAHPAALRRVQGDPVGAGRFDEEGLAIRARGRPDRPERHR